MDSDFRCSNVMCIPAAIGRQYYSKLFFPSNSPFFIRIIAREQHKKKILPFMMSVMPEK